MKLEIEKIRLNELESFVQSGTFNLFEYIPITPARAKSYMHNPHSHPEDVVLYFGFADAQLIAFRSLFAGTVQTENEQVRFAWCSGNWVHPDYRRRGFSEQLLNEAFSDWDGKLMFTNYAPASEKLYLKTGWFHSVHQFTGMRGYLFPKTGKLIAAANNNRISKLIFSVIDFFVLIFSEMRLWFFNAEKNPDFKFENIQFPDDQCNQFIQKSSSDLLFNRGIKELSWIFQYPWISSAKETFTKKYPFSSSSDSFFYQTVEIFIKNELAGFFIFSVREGHLKTLYFNIPEGIENEVANYLKQYIKFHKIEMITVYKTEVAKQLLARKYPFLHVKKYGQRIYSSFKLGEVGKYQVQDGDGDVFFT